MSEPHPAIEAVRARAIAQIREGVDRAVATDVHTFKATTKKPPAALIAIAVRCRTGVASIVLAIDSSEYLDPLRIEESVPAFILEFEGADPYVPPTAIERAKRA